MNFVPKSKPFSIMHFSQDFSFDSTASRLFGGRKHFVFMACRAVVFPSRSHRYRSSRSHSPHQLINIYESGIFAAFRFGVLYLFRRETGLLRVISCRCRCAATGAAAGHHIEMCEKVQTPSGAVRKMCGKFVGRKKRRTENIKKIFLLCKRNLCRGRALPTPLASRRPLTTFSKRFVNI